MAARILFTEGALVGRAFPLPSGTTVVGRSRQCGIVVPAPDVSGRHVALEVADGGVSLVNLSRHHTAVGLTEIPENNRVSLPPGVPVKIGGTTAFQLLVDAPAASSETVLPDAAGETSIPALGAPEEGTTEPSPAPDLNETQFLQTQLVSPEEIAKLIAGGARKRGRRLLVKVMLFVGLFLGVAAAYYTVQVRQRPEKTLTWPLTASGKYDIRSVDLPTPFGTDAFWADCPGSPQFRVRTGEDGTTEIQTRIGRKRDVDFRIVFRCMQSVGNLHRNRHQLFDAWRRAREERDGWNFQSVSPPAFLGGNSGLPYFDVQFLRTEKRGAESMQWFGHALFAVHGDCVLTLTREIPAVEQWRGATLVALEKLLRVNAKEIDGHWEGRPDARAASVKVLKDEAAGLLARKSPILWQETEFLLQSALIACGGHGEEAERLLAMLRELRANQKHEYRQFKVAWYQANRVRDKAGCRRVLESALKVFSSPDDRRNGLLKKGAW